MPDPAVIGHEVAAREYGRHYLEVVDARERLLAIAREDRDAERRSGLTISGDDFITAIQRYQAASERFCWHQDNLNESASADPRPTCVFCHRRLDEDKVAGRCHAQAERFGEHPQHKIKGDE